MTENSQVQVRRLMPADARLYREIRLEALQLSPEAFGSSFEQEGAQSLGYFEEALTKADVFGAFRETALVGIAGYRTQAGAKQAHKGMLWGMYVRPLARGSGVDNETAQRLYRHFGFVAYGHEVRSLKQGGRYYDELLMAVALDPTSS